MLKNILKNVEKQFGPKKYNFGTEIEDVKTKSKVMEKQIVKEFNVCIYDCNRKKFVTYDIIPYLLRVYNEKEKKPTTFEELKTFVKDESMYQFWARCEYEIILIDWPSQKTSKKIDVYEQIKMNLDTITNILINSIEEN